MNAKEKERALQRRIRETKEALMALGDLRPGTLSQQYSVCGKPGCRCKAEPPQKHGPYYQLSWYRKGKSTTRFVRRPDTSRVRRELKNYERLRSLVDRWINLSIELGELKLKQARSEQSRQEA